MWHGAANNKGRSAHLDVVMLVSGFPLRQARLVDVPAPPSFRTGKLLSVIWPHQPSASFTPPPPFSHDIHLSFACGLSRA